jgi:hypothetical protein
VCVCGFVACVGSPAVGVARAVLCQLCVKGVRALCVCVGVSAGLLPVLVLPPSGMLSLSFASCVSQVCVRFVCACARERVCYLCWYSRRRLLVEVLTCFFSGILRNSLASPMRCALRTFENVLSQLTNLLVCCVRMSCSLVARLSFFPPSRPFCFYVCFSL